MQLSEDVLNELDAGVRDLVNVLNQKNYITFMSCEGHKGKNKERGWISFCNNYPQFENLPNFCTVDERKHINWTYGEDEVDHKCRMEELLKWAMNLEPREIQHNNTFYGCIARRNRDNQQKIIYGSYTPLDFDKFMQEKSEKYHDFSFTQSWDEY